jgi:hypothetical protein
MKSIFLYLLKVQTLHQAKPHLRRHLELHLLCQPFCFLVGAAEPASCGATDHRNAACRPLDASIVHPILQACIGALKHWSNFEEPFRGTSFSPAVRIWSSCWTTPRLAVLSVTQSSCWAVLIACWEKKPGGKTSSWIPALTRATKQHLRHSYTHSPTHTILRPVPLQPPSSKARLIRFSNSLCSGNGKSSLWERACILRPVRRRFSCSSPAYAAACVNGISCRALPLCGLCIRCFAG